MSRPANSVALLLFIFLTLGFSSTTQASQEACEAQEKRAYTLLEDPPEDRAPILAILENAVRLCHRAASKASEPETVGDFLRRAALLRNTLLIHQPGDHFLERIQVLEKAVHEIAGICGDRCVALADPMEALAGLYERSKRTSEALELLEASLEIRRQAFGDSSYRLAQSHLLLGGFFSPTGRSADEIAQRGGSLEMSDKHFKKAADLVLGDDSTPRAEAIAVLRTYSGHLVRSHRLEESLGIQEIIESLEENP